MFEKKKKANLGDKDFQESVLIRLKEMEAQIAVLARGVDRINDSIVEYFEEVEDLGEIIQ
jgi:hypothetical protein